MTNANAPHPLAELTTKIGKITIAWNDLHFFVLAIFSEMNNRDPLKSAAIFFAVQADRTQRNMTEALIKEDSQMPPLLKQAAIDTLNDIGRTAGRRNDLVHAMWIFESDLDSGTATVFAPSSPRLSRKRLGEELDKLYEDAVKLSRRISTINRQIREYLDIVERHQAQHPNPPAPPGGYAASLPVDSLPDSPQDKPPQHSPLPK